jgi:3-oxoacyl-[acyl-carrier-protein] synthase-3
VATTIDAVAVAAGGLLRQRSGRKLADAAAAACLDRAGLTGDDVDLLINTGLYHDRNLGEPALAALIQSDIDANPQDPYPGGHGTFSFDIANGACGMLTGLRVADGFLRAGTIRHAVIVASDANPGRRMAPQFPFAPAGAAIVCGWHEGPAGLAGFRFGSRPADSDLFRALVGFDHGRNRLRIEQHPDFADRAAPWAASVAAGLLADSQLTPSDIDLVVANPLTAEFLDRLPAHLGVPRDRMVTVDTTIPVHTAGLAVALHEAWQDGRLDNASNVLLVSAGAGLTVAAALHRPSVP